RPAPRHRRRRGAALVGVTEDTTSDLASGLSRRCGPPTSPGANDDSIGAGMTITWPRSASARGGSAEEQLERSLEGWRPLLDALRASVFIASTSFDLVYMNQTARETMTAIDADVRAVFGVGARDLVGGSIHRFHR